jgi:hypothetical protein
MMWIGMYGRRIDLNAFFITLDEESQDNFQFESEDYELNPMTECPKCHLKYFGVGDLVNKCKSETVFLDFKIHAARCKHEEFHWESGVPCAKHLCSFFTNVHPALVKDVDNLETKWAPINHRDAVYIARDLVI